MRLRPSRSFRPPPDAQRAAEFRSRLDKLVTYVDEKEVRTTATEEVRVAVRRAALSAALRLTRRRPQQLQTVASLKRRVKKDVHDDPYPDKLPVAGLKNLLALRLADPMRWTPSLLAKEFGRDVEEVRTLLRYVTLPEELSQTADRLGVWPRNWIDPDLQHDTTDGSDQIDSNARVQMQIASSRDGKRE